MLGLFVVPQHSVIHGHSYSEGVKGVVHSSISTYACMLDAPQIWGNTASADNGAFGPADVYIGSTPWFTLGNTAVCATNVTTTSTLRSTLVMCSQTVTDARYVTVAKYISVGTAYAAYAEIQPLRKRKPWGIHPTQYACGAVFV